jgi:hypothetical protein
MPRHSPQHAPVQRSVSPMPAIARLCALAAACSCCAILAPSPAAARSSSDPPRATAASAIPGSRVQLMPRAALAFAAWNDQKDTYRDSYVNPRQWQIRLNGCDSVVDGQTIGPLSTKPSPSWTLEPLDGQAVDGQPLPAVSVPSEPGPGTCARTIFLRALGRWRITMTVTGAAGVPASVATERTFRDVLIAAVGDSFTSGEGGKTRNGSWADEQCDRGMNAWPALLARERVENGSITVTYLNFACSGAEVKQLTTEFYNGINPPRHLFPLKPQLQALRNAIGDPLNPAPRTVDLLVANVGINEMGGPASPTFSTRAPSASARSSPTSRSTAAKTSRATSRACRTSTTRWRWPRRPGCASGPCTSSAIRRGSSPTAATSSPDAARSAAWTAARCFGSTTPSTTSTARWRWRRCATAGRSRT